MEEGRRKPGAQGRRGENRMHEGGEVRKVIGAGYHGGDPAMHHVWQPRQSSEGRTRRYDGDISKEKGFMLPYIVRVEGRCKQYGSNGRIAK